MAEKKLPDNIVRIVAGKSYTENNIGLSGSRILMFDEYVLKIEKYRQKDAETVRVMQWLDNKLPVPRVICHEVVEETGYTLMSRIKGMSCDEYYLGHPEETVSLLADAMKMLWDIDSTDCPRDRGIEKELSEAKYRVDNHLVDLENVEPETFGEGGFKDPEELLLWLENHQPEYEPVFSHGDFCLPNIFFDEGKVSGFIDLGDAGIGDKWRDIALCYRSLKHNFEGRYGGKVYNGFNLGILFEKLGVKPNWEKLRYYILLDELF